MYHKEGDAVIKNNSLHTRMNYGSTAFRTGDMEVATICGGGRGDGAGAGPQQPVEVERYRVRFSGNKHWSLWDRFDGRWPATVADVTAALLSVAILWCLLRVNLDSALMAVPGGSVASIFLMYVSGAAAGRAAATIESLPPLLGMMVAGIALQNCGLYVVTDMWCVHLVAVMREAALSVILIKGGLELNASQLRRLSGSVVRLALIPCIAEALAAGVAAHIFLPNFSWEWGLTLGFTLSAVSPAVLVPSLLRLKRLGYGENSGVNTLVIAASSLDDIISISAFGVLLGIIFSTGDLTSKIIQGPVDVCIGTALGIVWGLLLIIVPPSPWSKIFDKSEDQETHKIQESRAERSVTAKRSVLLGAGGFLAVTGSQYYGYPGAGPLACIISSFVACNGWKWRMARRDRDEVLSFQGGETGQSAGETDLENPVEKVFEHLWFFLQPVLFASIGTEVKFELLSGGDMIVTGLIVLCSGLIVRVITTSLSIVGAGLNRKEVTFIQIAWLPKATVQAALAPVALDMARQKGLESDQESASRLLTIAVLSILLTAPIGAFGIQWFGPKLLSNSSS